MTKNNSSIPEDDFSTLFVKESEQVELLNELNKNKDIIEKDAGKYLDLDLEKHI